MERRTRTLGAGASALAAVGWGFAGIFASFVFASSIVLSFYRMWFAVALLLGLGLASGRKITWRAVRLSWPAGVILYADMCMFFTAIKYTTVAIATVIGALQPALVMIAANRLFGEHIDRRDTMWTVVAIAGVVTIVVGSSAPTHHQLVGDLFATGSVICWSAYFLVSKAARRQLETLEYTFGVAVSGAVTASVVLLVSGQSPAHVHAGDWLWITLLAVVPGSSHLFMNWAHRYIDVSIASLIGSSNPVVAAVAGLVILGQRLTVIQVVGGLVGVGAIAAVAFRHREPAGSPVE